MSPTFISYRRRDAGGHAGRVFERLRDRFGEQNVFFDQDAIEPGDNFPERIEAAIRSAAVVLVVIGPDWLESLNTRATDEKIDFVQREVSIAIERRADHTDQVEVIPLLVGGETMPERDHLHHNLRDSIGPLFDYQALTFQGSQQDQDNQFERLFARITTVAGTVPGTAMGRADEPPVLSIGATANKFPVPGLAWGPTLPPIDVDKFERVFRPVSRTLLDWPQETDGHWIERPELPRLLESTSRRSPSVTMLLGGPGEGKSAILARIGSLLARDGTVLLAIKADLLPREVASLRQLDDWIGCGDVDLATALCRIAEERRVVVLIDQLDALGELIDQHSGRLSTLLRLVESIRDTQNLHVIVSCREFECRHDLRLRTLRAEEVTLVRLPWDEVSAVLTARKIDTNHWSDEVRDVLSTPANLAIYLQILAQDVPIPNFTNYQALLDRVIKERLERVYGDSTVRAAERIATEMATEEELSLGRARFSDLSAELDNLESAGLISSSADGLRVSFRHQTLFDVLRARSFLRDGPSLADYVVHQKQQSLFVRPTLWSALNYLRASDTPTYRNEFRRLWRDSALRLHLRYLLIAFLGQVAEPTDEEAGFLFSRLHAHDTRPRVLWAMTGNATGWYSRLSERLPQLMTEPPRQAWAAAQFLAGAINQQRDSVLSLMQRHWMTQAAYLRHVLHALGQLRSWDTEAMHVATTCVKRIVDQAPTDTFLIHGLLDASARSSPNLALKLLAHFLNVRTARITDDSSDGAERDSSQHRSQEYKKLFRDTIWYRISEMFGKHPKLLVASVWPWFIEIFGRIADERTPFRNSYRAHAGLIFSSTADESDLFQRTVEQAIRGFAGNFPDAFLCFVKANEDSDLNVVHRVLALGLERLATKRPKAVLRYLLGDDRRFAIGDIWDDHRISVALIDAVAPALGLEDVHRLEATIIGWRYYSTDSDAKYRLEDEKSSREHRLPLLRALPFERMSTEGQRHLREEERAFPYVTRHEPPSADIRSVDSPMSAPQMTKAKDQDIIRLFDTLTDTTGWEHPTRGWPNKVGGSIQASREFAEFAETAPERALQIIEGFEPGKTERPAGNALAALGTTDVPPDTLIECIRQLDQRGFASEPFRIEAARCLREVARRDRGLDDDTCKLLEGWITERSSASPDCAGSSDDSTPTIGDSILWGPHGFFALPGGNYPILDALTLGYVLRHEPDLSGWLAVLERHLKREEDSRVWSALARYMPHLVDADDGRGIRFLSALFVRFPTILETTAGVMLVGQIVGRLPDWITRGIVDRWVSGDWEHGPQSAGEVVALKLCRQPDSEPALALVEQLLSGGDLDQEVVDGLRVGLTYTFSRAWHESELRALSTPFLIRLINSAGSSVDVVLQSVFRKSSPLPVDVHTRELLEAVLERPSVLVAQNVYFLVRSLKGLLYEDGYPVLVYDVARTLIEQAVRDRSRSEAVRNLSELADLALTLHRIPDTREHGLELFERLLEADASGLSDSLKMIDRPAFR